MLSAYAKEGKSSEELMNELRQYLHLPEQEATSLFESRIEALSFRRYVARVGDHVVLLKASEKSLVAHVSKLVDGVIYRLQVREGKKPDSVTFDIIDKVIESVLMIRSWDLGACFAGATNGDIPNVFHTVQEQVDRYAKDCSSVEKQALARSISNLFNQPNSQESALLGDLGRVAFGLQLVSNNPCLAFSEVLPEKIYFDASVLMPAIVEGHPYSSAYRDAISRLRRAVQSSGKELSLWVTKDFINEVISHRNLAIREVNELGLFNPENLERHIGLYGQDANVFITAYANRVGRVKEKVKFDAFINEVAPYSTEDQLEAYLKTKEAIKTDLSAFNSEDESRRSSEISKNLHKAYEQDRKPGFDNKSQILINHEAHQLAKLIFDLERGMKTIFITADQRFRRLASEVVPGKIGSAIISGAID
jgi:thymidylate synthase